jgi:hypothetical protein
MATTLTPLPGTLVTLVNAVAMPAADSNLLAGWQSASVNNTQAGDAADDSLVQIIATTSGTITAAGVIKVYSYGSTDNSHFTGVGTTATAGNLTFPASASNQTGPVDLLPLLETIGADTTARTYITDALSLANARQGTMPPYWGLWIVHNVTGATVTITAQYVPVKYQNA